MSYPGHQSAAPEGSVTGLSRTRTSPVPGPWYGIGSDPRPGSRDSGLRWRRWVRRFRACIPKSLPGAILALVLAAQWPNLLPAQQEEWEGKEVREVRGGDGWRRHRFENFKLLLNARAGAVYTTDKRKQDYHTLHDRSLFAEVTIEPKVERGMLVVTVSVVEFDLVSNVEFQGHTVYSTSQLMAALRTAAGGYLSPVNLKLDGDTISEMYVNKGYAFFRLRQELRPTPRGVHLVWHINEGPMVSIEAIEFTGNEHISASDLRQYMVTRENDYLLFIPTGKNPYIERTLKEIDIERVKLQYSLEGWLDIHNDKPRPRVFVEDVVFNEEKTAVRILIHVEEGNRFRIRNVRIRGNTIFSEQEIRGWLRCKPGDFYTKRNAGLDVGKIREKYGERAYILAEVEPEELIADSVEGHELDLLFDIKENGKVYVGKVAIQGNTKTRETVIRREITRANFVPGEEFNSRSLEKGINRLRATGWFGGDAHDPSRGVAIRNVPTADPDTQDVTIDVKEGQTGNIRFAAGYSSAFGILGVVEFTQRNFDIADLPKSFSDLVDGNGFAGGGQFLRLRFTPAAKRQSFLAEFKEPYFFGYEIGLGVRGYLTRTLRESWDEQRTGGSLFFEKPFDPFRVELALGGYEIRITDVGSNSPASIVSIAGTNVLMSLTPSIVFDTRNSPLFPSEGALMTLSFEYAGQILPGDFDYNKLTFDSQFFFPIYETESHLKHVLSLQFTFGWADPRRQATSLPIFERYFAGGRGSIRGFKFRGVGPKENGDPVGGMAYVYGSVEYSFPLFTEILRAAVFWDIADLATDLSDLRDTKFRNAIGFGIRFMIPQLSNVPVAIDFGFPLTQADGDEEETVTFDIGRLF